MPTDNQVSSDLNNEFKHPVNPQTYIQEKDELLKDIDNNSSELKRTMRANGLFLPEDLKYNDVFYRFPRIDPYNYIDGAREYLFFTKPDLPILGSGGQLAYHADDISYFNDLMESPGYRKSIFGNLCQTRGETKTCPFMKILSNRKTSNLDVTDIQVEEIETAVNMYGNRVLYPKSSQLSDENMDFTIEFEDTKYQEIYHLFKAWDYYRRLKWYGILGPGVSNMSRTGRLNNWSLNIGRSDYDTYSMYSLYKILYDHISIYKILVASDGYTILYIGKVIGCFPNSISRSSFSEIPDKGPLKITIGFKMSGWYEDNLPPIVTDFNELVDSWAKADNAGISFTAGSSNLVKLWDEDIGAISQENVMYPYILKGDEDSNGFRQRYLCWFNKK